MNQLKRRAPRQDKGEQLTDAGHWKLPAWNNDFRDFYNAEEMKVQQGEAH